MKLKALKLRNATILNNREMKAVWGRNGYDDTIYDAGYLPEVYVVCDARPPGRCWERVEGGCRFTGNQLDWC